MVKVYLILLGLLSIRLMLYYVPTSERAIGSDISVSGRLAQEPGVEAGKYVLEVEGLKAYVPVENPYHYGDYVSISGQFAGRYIKDPSVTLISAGSDAGQPNPAERVRNIYFRLLPSRQADILAGIVLGSNQMERKLKNDLANAGLIHLVVASGMNLTLLGAFFSSIFMGFRVGRSFSMLLISLAVIGYAFLTGFNPPIVRAMIMFEAVLVAGLLGRRSSGLFALIATAYGMLWVNPGLVVSYSFLLSFASMMGQIFVSSVKLTLPKGAYAILLIVMQNLSAVLFTLPIVLIGFAKFSLVSMITNIMVVWVVEPLMVIGGLAGIVGFLSIDGARTLINPISFLLEYFVWVVEVFGGSEKFVWRIEGFNLFMAIGYYLVLAGTISAFASRRRSSIIN